METIFVFGLAGDDPTGHVQDDPPPATPAAPLVWHPEQGWLPADGETPYVARLTADEPVPALLAGTGQAGYLILIAREGTEGFFDLEGNPWEPPEAPPSRRRRSSD